MGGLRAANSEAHRATIAPLARLAIGLISPRWITTGECKAAPQRAACLAVADSAVRLGSP